jgi:hypothetical protein
LGVGPGVGTYLRQQRLIGIIRGPSHTEYTRLLAEHGVFGILAMFCLFALALRAIRGAPDLASRGISAAMIIWALLFMSIYATRLAAPAFVFGLAFAYPPVKRSPAGFGEAMVRT